MSDRITISDLSIHLAQGLGASAFGLTPPPPCPISIDLIIHLRPEIIPLVASHDSMASLGVNYSSVSKSIYAALSDPTRRFNDATEVMDVIAGCALVLDCVERVEVSVSLPRALLHAQQVRYTAEYTSKGDVKGRSVEIQEMRVACVIGLHPHERKERQRLEVDLKVRTDRRRGRLDHKAIHDRLMSDLEASSAGTLEALADQIAHKVLSHLPADTSIDLTIRKPSALPFATPSITISRSTLDYSPSPRPLPPAEAGPSTSTTKPRIFVALGSNIGDRFGNIRRAVRLLEEEGVKCIATGRMYESEPMYVEDQARFANTVIEVICDLEPLPLLRVLKKVERATGRTKTFTNGPRVVDLDLLFYGTQIIKDGKKGDAEDESGVGWLELPHWGIAEREFVLRPLNDIAPTFVHPTLGLPISVLLSRLDQTLVPVIPTPTPLRLDPDRIPLIMAIFNATPDSFSDGSADRLNVDHALTAIREMFASGHKPDILDIGGMSTRPGSTPCSEEEELSRVVPLIRAIRAEPEFKEMVISIDTYRASVARAAVEAGANVINDVRGGREEGMMETMAELGVPVVLMHSRGDSSSMTSSESQDYTTYGGVVSGVQQEMGDIYRQALEKGVKGWDIILDPGIGFAKSPSQSIELLQQLPSLKDGVGRGGYPLLVGASRKGFVGKVTGRTEADQRDWGDAVVNAHCVRQGVEILRVHDWRGARESVQMARALMLSTTR